MNKQIIEHKLIENFQQLLNEFIKQYTDFEEKLWKNVSNENSALKQMSTWKQFIEKLELAISLKIDFYEVFGKKNPDTLECESLFYKLSDLWFAYETLLKLIKIEDKDINAKEKKMEWLIDGEEYFNDTIQYALKHAKESLKKDFDGIQSVKLKRYLSVFSMERGHVIKTLKEWIDGGEENIKGQIKRLKPIYDAIPFVDNSQATHSGLPKNENPNTEVVADYSSLTSKDILALTYSIRNNFVHNGETSEAFPDFANVDFYAKEKIELLKICYSFLLTIVLSISNQLLGKINS